MAMGHECFQTMVRSWFCVSITCPIHEIFGCFKFPEWMTQRGSNGSKDLDMHPAHRNLYPFLALLCVRACDSPKRSAPAAVFTCRSLAIAAFYLVVALWKMENWQDILRIFIVRFVLCIWKGFVWQSESIFKGQASPRLACLCLAFRCNQAILQSRDCEQTKRTKNVSQETRLEQSPDRVRSKSQL